jgi:hypothetical protein
VTVPAAVPIPIMIVFELEHIEQIADGRAVERHVWVIRMRNRIREIIAAPRR